VGQFSLQLEKTGQNYQTQWAKILVTLLVCERHQKKER
jgi:hypothetical protein